MAAEKPTPKDSSGKIRKLVDDFLSPKKPEPKSRAAQPEPKTPVEAEKKEPGRFSLGRKKQEKQEKPGTVKIKKEKEKKVRPDWNVSIKKASERFTQLGQKTSEAGQRFVKGSKQFGKEAGKYLFPEAAKK